MAISAKDVKRLRDMTGVGMMDCKKALQEADGDFDLAVEILRKQGQKVAAKRADRDANEGLITTALSDDNSVAAIVEVNCETDFVARNADFEEFANAVAELVLREKPADMEAFLALDFDAGRPMSDALTDMTGKIGERIDVRRFAVVEAEAGTLVSYIHPGSRLGVLVEVSGNNSVADVGVDVAMQAAALNPIATRREEVPADIQKQELDIAREAALNDGKPENIVDRIAQGKLERYFKDHVLLEQPFVKDASVSVKEMVANAGVEVHRFVRYALGD